MFIEYTPIQQKFLDVLADGFPHRREELLASLNDSEARINNVNDHLSKLRKKLRLKGQDIICELSQRRICYRWVILISSSNE